jgi:hydrogenase/urease accessory protein HupE
MRIGLTTAALTLIPIAAFAHPGIGDAHGFVHGFAHPLGGLDHILAMVGCCARAASGHTEAPPSSVMKSRRLTSDMGLPPRPG